MIETTLIEVKQVDKNNKGLFSKAEFKPWSTLLGCQPICTSVSIECRNRFCSHCLLEKEVSRCSQCKVPYYCSKDCQKQDWKLHKSECSALKKMGEKGINAAKINMEMLLNLRLWLIRQKNKEVNKQVEQMCNLIEFQTAERLAQFQQTAVALISLLEIERDEANMSQLVKQQSVVSLNSFTIQDYLCNQECVGLGLYWPANFINHHCHPNCSQIFDGRNLKIIANRPIERGEEITISYVPALESWANKQKLCREGYLFECFCEECQVNKMFDESLMYLKCPYCQTCSIKANKKKAKDKEGSDEEESVKDGPRFQCQGCKKAIPDNQIDEIIQKANKYLQTIKPEDNNYETVKKSLLGLRKLISTGDPRMKDCIYKAYSLSLMEVKNDSKIYQESYILLKEMLEHVPKWYRLNPEDEIPYVYVWRYAELGKLAYYLQKLKKACQYTEKAYEIVEKIKFKNEFTEVKELKLRYQEMKIGLSFNKAQIFRKSQH